MNRQQIGDFTKRISQGNRSELVVILYEIFFAYLDDAGEAYREDRWDDCRDFLRKAQRAIDELRGALDFSYELAGRLDAVYRFCKDSIARCMYMRTLEGANQARALMEKLYDAFAKVAEQDDSPPLMKNSQQVYAGYTYGRDDVSEAYEGDEKNRGYLA